MSGAIEAREKRCLGMTVLGLCQVTIDTPAFSETSDKESLRYGLSAKQQTTINSNERNGENKKSSLTKILVSP